MSRLTRTPLSMVEAQNAKTDQKVIFDGKRLTTRDLNSLTGNTIVSAAKYDTETGIFVIEQTDEAGITNVITVSGFMTSGNIGRGPTGPTGPRGEAGEKGKDGKDGRAGSQGCAGPKGDTGAIGPTGPMGPTGPGGVAGPTGPTGPRGETGPAGRDAPEGNYTVTDGQAIDILGKRVLITGHVNSSEPSLAKRVLFKKTLDNSTNLSAFLQFVEPNSPIAGKVKISDVTRGYLELSVDPNLLQKDATGNPVPATGWNFYYLIFGEVTVS